MKNKTKGQIVRWTATIVCVGAPLATTLSQFPIWIAKSSKATMSGVFLVLVFLCCIPFYRQIRDYFKSPAAWVLWTVFTLLCIALRNIIDQLLIVGAVGAVSNVIGAWLYKLGDWLMAKPDKEGDSDGSTT